jgi:hypothetical protein
VARKMRSRASRGISARNLKTKRPQRWFGIEPVAALSQSIMPITHNYRTEKITRTSGPRPTQQGGVGIDLHAQRQLGEPHRTGNLRGGRAATSWAATLGIASRRCMPSTAALCCTPQLAAPPYGASNIRPSATPTRQYSFRTQSSWAYTSRAALPRNSSSK